MRITTLLVLFFGLCVNCYAQADVEAYTLIAQGESEKGVKLLEAQFETLTKVEKINAALVLSQASPQFLKNSSAYYAKYSLKFNPEVQPLDKAKLIRILADELFAQGDVQGASLKYEEALNLKPDDQQLIIYLKYKLGWTYVNLDKYEKLFTIWKDDLKQEHSLLTNFVHDYGKFWMEYSLKTKKLHPIPEFLIKENAQFEKGLMAGLEREFKEKLPLTDMLAKASSDKERSYFYEALLLNKQLSACEKTKISGVVKVKDEKVLKPILDVCLEISLGKEDKELLSKLETLYAANSGSYREKAILKLKRNDHPAVCAQFLEIYEKSNDEASLDLAARAQQIAACLQAPYTDRLVKQLSKNLKTWPVATVDLLLVQPVVAQAFVQKLPKNWAAEKSSSKLALLTGLEGQAGYVAYYQQHQKNPESLLRHFQSSQDLIPKEFASESPELQLLAASRNKDYSSLNVETVMNSCNNFTQYGVQLLVDYIIQKKDSNLFFQHFDCFKKVNIDLNDQVRMALLSSATIKSPDSFINYVNELVYMPSAAIDPGHNLKLNGFKSLSILSDIRATLQKSRKFSLQQLPVLDNKIVRNRNSIIKTEWMSEELKDQMVGHFNTFLDSTKSRIEILALSENDKKMLITRYEGMKIQ